ncbi:ABC transporter permease [Falsiroseomonas oryzae]|uniref:ABC transporter permease n=1 Tax=Falsiroseomonas oryzae TaxID=2766473 RepID=UPI0022EB2052|nr:ABC transporter permease [Roseomonas sp. MO-31]
MPSSIPASSIAEAAVAPAPSAWRIFRHNRAAVAAGAILVLLAAFALLGPALAPFDPVRTGVGPSMAPPGLPHLMGTDELGRDVLSRAAGGLRISLLVGLGAAGAATLIGLLVGGVAGFFGGLIDDALMRVTEVFQVIPRFFLAILLVAFFGAGLFNIIFAIAILGWPEVARLVRAEVLTLRSRPFVDAARVAGASRTALIVGEILPNAMGPVVVNTSLLVGQAMLLEAGLSYLGLGDPGVVSLGVMLQEAQQIMRSAWWTSAFPGLLIFLAVLALNLLGDGLNDVLDPRARER